MITPSSVALSPMFQPFFPNKAPKATDGQAKEQHFDTANVPLYPLGQKPVLLSSDIDDTMIHWLYKQKFLDPHALAENAHMLQSHHGQMADLLNTGRGLVGLKALGPALKDVPVDYLAVKNGEELYINRGHLPTDQWIKSLTPANREQYWTQEIERRTGWQPERVQQILFSTILQAGFQPTQHPLFSNDAYAAEGYQAFVKPITPDHTAIVYGFLDQPNFVVSAMHYNPENGKLERGAKEVDEQLGFELLGTFKDHMKQEGMDVGSNSFFRDMGDDKTRFYGTFPKGVDKSTVVEGILHSFEPNAQAVITAGDHPSNDTATLLRNSFIAGTGQEIPNFPILSGSHKEFLEQFEKQPRGIHMDHGKLGAAIEADLNSIQANVEAPIVNVNHSKKSPMDINPFTQANFELAS